MHMVGIEFCLSDTNCQIFCDGTKLYYGMDNSLLQTPESMQQLSCSLLTAVCLVCASSWFLLLSISWATGLDDGSANHFCKLIQISQFHTPSGIKHSFKVNSFSSYSLLLLHWSFSNFVLPLSLFFPLMFFPLFFPFPMPDNIKIHQSWDRAEILTWTRCLTIFVS